MLKTRIWWQLFAGLPGFLCSVLFLACCLVNKPI